MTNKIYNKYLLILVMIFYLIRINYNNYKLNHYYLAIMIIHNIMNQYQF